MKRIVIACGAGLATSSMVRDRVEEALSVAGISCQFIQCTLNEVAGYDGSVDIIITTMKVIDTYQSPLIHGSAYLTGINEDRVTEKIIAILKA